MSTDCVLKAYKVSLDYMQQLNGSCAYKLIITTFNNSIFGQVICSIELKFPPKVYFKFPENMYIYTLCLNRLKSLIKFHTAVYKDMLIEVQNNKNIHRN